MNTVRNQKIKYWLKSNLKPAFKILRRFSKWIPSKTLTSISVDISGMCNLDCTMCSLQKWFDNKGMMTLETFKKLEKALPRLTSIVLHCNCEPLVNKDIVQIIEFIKMKNKDIEVGFVTNGMLLKPTVISQLLRAGTNWIDVSLDGATKDTYEMIRKGANFEQVIRNIKELVAQRKSVNNDLRFINIRTVASKVNVQELSGILDLANSMEVDGFIISGLDAYSEEMKDNMLYANYREDVNPDYKEIFAELSKRAMKYGLYTSIPSLHSIPYDSCSLKQCLISWNGEVSPCPLLSYQRPYYYFGEELMHPKIIFGNIYDSDIFDIWESEKFTNFRGDLRRGRLPQYCRKCLWKNGVLCEL